MPESRLPNTHAIFCLVVLQLIGGCKQFNLPKTETVPELSVEELLANPQSYSHMMVSVTGCCVWGVESVTLRPCHSKELENAIWIEDARVVREMEKLRPPDVPDVTPKGLERPLAKRMLFAYEEARNDETWKKLKPPPDGEQAVLEVVLLGQLEAIEQRFQLETQPSQSE